MVQIEKAVPSAGSKHRVVRYVMVGGFNTVLGYALFAFFNILFRSVPRGYVLASFFTYVIWITVAFLGYKWFVFKTRGNYIREWLRTFAVYATSMITTLVGMAVLVPVLQHRLSHPNYAPYIASAALGMATMAASFFGHKHFSFRATKGISPDRST